MLALSPALVEKLQGQRVRITAPDGDSVLLHRVPANPRFFNKKRTMLLIKRPAPGLPFVACVDADLQYTGEDAQIDMAFAQGPHRQGWRALALGQAVGADLQSVLRNVLEVLGFRGVATAVPPDCGLLQTIGIVLPQPGVFQPTIGRQQELDRIVASLHRRGETRLVLITGESGSGKTNLLHGVAHELERRLFTSQVVSVDLPRLLANSTSSAQHTAIVFELLDEARRRPQTIMAVEHIESLLRSVPHADLILERFADNGGRLIGTTLPGCLKRLLSGALGRRMDVVILAEPSMRRMLAILESARGSIAEHHGIEIDPCCVRACLRQSLALAGSQPGKALALLDAAAAHARASGATVVGGDDIYGTIATWNGPHDNDVNQ